MEHYTNFYANWTIFQRLEDMWVHVFCRIAKAKFRFSAKNGQNLRKLAAWGVKNLTKNFTKMAENWPFFDKKLAFFFSEPFGTYLVSKKILGVTCPILADFSAKRRRLRPNFTPKPVIREFLL